MRARPACPFKFHCGINLSQRRDLWQENVRARRIYHRACPRDLMPAAHALRLSGERGVPMAGRLPDSFFDDLRARLDIVDVVSSYVQLKQKGRRYWGLCPFHREKSASFSVDSESQMFYCFGCHEGGTAIHFVMEMEHMEFMEAVTMLAERANLPMPDRVSDGNEAASKQLKERLYLANQAAAKCFHQALYEPEGASVLTYLHKRGLDDPAIRRFGLGAAPERRNALPDALTEQGFTTDELLKAGLIGQKDGRTYDMFRGRAIFPIINAQGRVLGFGGRAMGDAQPKYLNTSDTPIFNKRQGLYAMNMVRKEGPLRRLILVEGYMDTVSLRKAGVDGVVATLGTALTPEQARLIKRYAPEVIVSYDGDSAGQKAILRALDILDEEEMKANVLVFPDGLDPDDFVRMHGTEGFLALRPMGAMEYRMLRVKDDFDLSTEQGRMDYAIRCCELLKKLKNPIEIEAHLKRLVMDTGFERDVLLAQVGAELLKPDPKKSMRPTIRRGQQKAPESEIERAERTLLMLISKSLLPETAVSAEDFETPLYQDIARQLLEGAQGASILDQLEGDDRARAAMALNPEFVPDEKNALPMAEDCIMQIQVHRIEQAQLALNEQLKTAQGTERRALLEQMQQITQQLSRLKNGRKGWSG